MLMTAEMHHHSLVRVYACIGLSPCTNCKDCLGSSRNPIMRKRVRKSEAPLVFTVQGKYLVFT